MNESDVQGWSDMMQEGLGEIRGMRRGTYGGRYKLI